ncbi:MAG: hypothetical protein ACP5LW_06225 [Nitrososphaeria archaeon]
MESGEPRDSARLGFLKRRGCSACRLYRITELGKAIAGLQELQAD